jgi:tRNA modification GTPase
VGAALLDPPAVRPRYATFTRLVGPGGAIDQAVATYFPRPGSYTGEDVVEVSAHGSPVLLREILRLAIAAGARLAEPGEFTLRAYLNGRIDLVQAEAVADLVESVTPLQARLAFDQLQGTLTTAIAPIEAGIFDLNARLEASLDFPDEGYHFVDPAGAAFEIAARIAQVDTLLRNAVRGRLVREGRQAVIVGRTNAGKSTLFNFLAGAERAIVTSIPGTTRDLLTELVDIDGVPITLVDTAGIRESSDVVEAEGVARARQAVATADLRIFVLDRSRPLEREAEAIAGGGAPSLVVVNKCDLPPRWSLDDLPATDPVVPISLKTGEGLDDVRPALARVLAGDGLRSDAPAVTNVRHIALLEQCRRALARAADAAAGRASEEFVLADLHEARAALEEITGRRAPDEMLAHIFARFCIGK